MIVDPLREGGGFPAMVGARTAREWSLTMTDAAALSFASRPVPPMPEPGERALSKLELLLKLRRNPLTIWRRVHFEEPIVAGNGLLGPAVVVSDPASIRHVFVDNVANYRKDDFQRAILAPGLGEGLLTAEGEAWKRARRIVAPLFTPKAVAGLALRMQRPAITTAERMASRRPGRIVDIGEDMTRVTYDVLSETLFSNTIDGGAETFSRALRGYFDTQGRIDPLDILKAPAFIPRIGRILARPAIAFFEAEVVRIIKARQEALAAGTVDRARPDLLTALLDARDPETGSGLTDREVAANIVTFIGAGHETTANALTWSLYLLSQAPGVREIVEREADDAAGDVVAAALDGRGLADDPRGGGGGDAALSACRLAVAHRARGRSGGRYADPEGSAGGRFALCAAPA